MFWQVRAFGIYTFIPHIRYMPTYECTYDCGGKSKAAILVDDPLCDDCNTPMRLNK
jgi:hypothetical protein